MKRDAHRPAGLRSRSAWIVPAFLVPVLLGSSALADTPSPQKRVTHGTARMVERLQALDREMDLRFNTFLNKRRLQAVRSSPAPTRLEDQLAFIYMVGREQLLSGDSVGAVQSFEVLARALEENENLPIDEGARRNMREHLALAYLRLGEQENCIENHTIERCLLPIRDGGIHTVERGSRGAVRLYTGLLEDDPENLAYRWLLNIAAMTLGEHPAGVPETWRIPAAAFESGGELPRFQDVAPQVGLDIFGLSGGSILDDFDGDGYLDVMASAWGLDEQLRLFLNNRDGTFSERTAEAGLTGITGGLNILQADVDNDGDLDVFVLRGAWLQDAGRIPNSLLLNEIRDGRPSFRDATEDAGLLSLHPTQVAAWGDYDNDGWIDLFVGNESVAESLHPVELFHNLGPGEDGRVRFGEVSKEVGLELTAYVKGAAWGDVDNDGLLDLYVSNLGGRNFLYHNRGAREGGWSFAEVAREAGVAEPLASFPTWFFDYDNDGWLDIFVSGYKGSIADVAAEYLGRPFPAAETPRLYRNRGQGVSFENVTREVGLETILMTMGTNFGDLDGDGWLDFYAGTGDTELRSLMPNRMFRNAGGERFIDVTTAGGFGHLQKGHGVGWGDLDNDGDEDVYAVMGGAHDGDGFHNALFENPGHGHRWLALDLEGVTANRAAIGARLRVIVATGDRQRTVHATVGSGGSFGASSLRQEIGLGDAERLVAVEIAWPGSREVQRLEGLEMEGFYRIRQGEAEAVRFELKALKLGGGAPDGHGGHGR